MRVALAGGGTGGHVFPAVAIAEELRRRDPDLQLMYLGRRGSVEERVAAEMMIPFRSIFVEGMAGKSAPRKAYSLFSAGVAGARTRAIAALNAALKACDNEAGKREIRRLLGKATQ